MECDVRRSSASDINLNLEVVTFLGSHLKAALGQAQVLVPTSLGDVAGDVTS
jgi:hypothetical protein